MKLGIIAPNVSEESFRKAREYGLDFVEFTINGGNDGSELFDHMDDVKRWMDKYQLEVGSIGRWKTVEQLPDGSLDPFEMDMAKKLMQAARELNCPNYVCGCNYQDGRSLYDNYTSAIAFFSQVLDMRPEGITVADYNCQKGNFVIAPEQWKVVLGHLPELMIKYDPAHTYDFGRDPLAELVEWGDRVVHMHLKGSLFVNGQRVDDTPCGLDQTPWKSILGILVTKGFDGTMSLEPHGNFWTGPNEAAGVKYSVAYMRSIMVR
ncbi:MAG: sugar phosphate isomerase/epimerase [Oscillospiraceae bacterium]|nr:sugar phosphate isomerase/epimerase [Oscillospiraceae bacterium]